MLILSQLIIIAYAFEMAMFQATIIKGMRAYWPVNNPYSKPFHSFGWMMAATVGITLAVLQDAMLLQMASIVASALWYSLVFDIVIGWKVYDNLFYLGDTSGVDNTIKKVVAAVNSFSNKVIGKLLPKAGFKVNIEAGLVKATVVAAILVTMNILIA